MVFRVYNHDHTLIVSHKPCSNGKWAQIIEIPKDIGYLTQPIEQIIQMDVGKKSKITMLKIIYFNLDECLAQIGKGNIIIKI